MKKQYSVIRDTREKVGHGYEWPITESCLGTTIKKLDTGDYSLEGFQDVFVIERKDSISELATNLTEKRFWNELDRLEEFKYPFLFLDFYIDDVILFPQTSNIPIWKQKDIKVTNKFLMMKINEIQVKYKTKVMFVGPYGHEVASSLFKRIVDTV